jgi:hypothetical protein
MIARSLLLSTLAWSLGTAWGAPEPAIAPREMRAVRAATAPVLDGRVDDGAWTQAAVDDRFVQMFPASGQPPTERTEMRVVYDDEAVYIALRMFDAQSEGIVGRLTRRDRDIETDWVAVGFDSQHDKHTAYYFAVSAAGVQSDGVFHDDSELNKDWDAVWDSAVRREATGWSAELKIPLSVLRFSAADIQTWGFQAWRHISRKKEDVAWAFHPNNVQGEVSWFGELGGLSGLRPRRTIELRPFLIARLGATTNAGGSFFGAGGSGRDVDVGLDGGLDAKIGLTSNLTLDATINPDFGQVEADQVVLNLSRFETFFPEKRPFFIEGADLFQTPLQLFYSRRIGQSPNRLGNDSPLIASEGMPATIVSAPRALRIWSATKLTGSVADGVTVGVLGAVTDTERVTVTSDAGDSRSLELAPSQAYSVARARASVGNGFVGALATAVNRLGGQVYRADADHDAYTQGLDGYWMTAGGKYRFTAQAVMSERVGGGARQTEEGQTCQDPPDGSRCVPITRQDGTRMEPGAVGYGGTAQLDGRDGKFYLQAKYRGLSPKLDLNDAGFLPEFNVHSLSLVSGYLDSEPKGIFQELGIFGFANGARSFDGVVKDAWAGARAKAQFRNFVSAEGEIAALLPGNWDTAETLDGGRLERVWGLNPSASIHSDSRKDLVVEGYAWTFLRNGSQATSVGGGLTMTYQITPRLQVELTPDLSWDEHTVHLYDCKDELGMSCTVETVQRHYRFAELDSGTISLTTRGTYTLSPRLSLQWYGQLFAAKGQYAKYTETDTTELRPAIYRADLRPSTFGGDSDGDGEKDDDFQDTSLNLNAVLRWEFRPGSVVYAVYTRSQSADVDLAGRPPRFRIQGLGTGPTEEVAMLKLIYFMR